MSLWDTSPWNNFYEPNSRPICHKWHKETSGIFTPMQVTVGTCFHTGHGTKTTPISIFDNEEASCSVVPNSVSLLSRGTVQPEKTYSCILKVPGLVWESQWG